MSRFLPTLLCRVLQLLNVRDSLPVHLPILANKPKAKDNAQHSHQERERSANPHALDIPRALVRGKNISPEQGPALSDGREDRVPARPLTLSGVYIGNPAQQQRDGGKNQDFEEQGKVPRCRSRRAGADDETDKG